MHAKSSHEVPFHEPEGLGQQERIRYLLCHAIHHFAPEFNRHGAVKLLTREAVFCPCGDCSARSGFREPQTLIVALGQRHGRVEADNGKLSRNMEDRLDYGLAHLGVQEIQLGGVVPRHAGAVVAVVDEFLASGPEIHPLEDHRGI